MDANILVNMYMSKREIIDVRDLTISEVLKLKNILGLSNSEAISIFFRGVNRGNI